MLALINSFVFFLSWRLVKMNSHSIRSYMFFAALDIIIGVICFVGSIWILFDIITALSVLFLFGSTFGWRIIVYSEEVFDMLAWGRTEKTISRIENRLENKVRINDA